MRKIMKTLLLGLLALSTLRAEFVDHGEQDNPVIASKPSLNSEELSHLFLSSDRDPLLLLGEQELELFKSVRIDTLNEKNFGNVSECVQRTEQGQRLVSSKLFVAALEELLLESEQQKNPSKSYKSIFAILDGIQECTATFQFGEQEAQRLVKVCNGVENLWLKKNDARGAHNVLVEKLQPPKVIDILGTLTVDRIKTNLLEVGPIRGQTVIPAAFADCLAFNTGNIGDTHYFGAIPGSGSITSAADTGGGTSRGIEINLSEAPTRGIYVKLIVIGENPAGGSSFFSLSYFIEPNLNVCPFSDVGIGGTNIVNFGGANTPQGTGVTPAGVTLSLATSPFFITIRVSADSTSAGSRVDNPTFIYKIVGENVTSVVESVGTAFATT